MARRHYDAGQIPASRALEGIQTIARQLAKMSSKPPAAFLDRNRDLPTELDVTKAATKRRVARFRRVREQLLTDRGGDPTEAQRILADNAAGLAMRCEEMLVDLLNGSPTLDLAHLNSTVNSLRRLLETLGIQRVPRDITTLASYLEKRQQPIVQEPSTNESQAPVIEGDVVQ